MNPTPTKRWSDLVRTGRVFCGPEGVGHHIPARFIVPESGFVQCTEHAAPHELLELRRLRANGATPAVHRFETMMRAAGVDVPSDQVLRRMIADAPMCGRWVFLLAVRGGGIIVAEVSKDDRLAMEGLSTPAEMLEYLGVFKQR